MALCHTLFQTKKDIELKIKLLTDINLSSLMPYEDNNFSGSFVLDFRKCWRHVQPKIQCSATVGYSFNANPVTNLTVHQLSSFVYFVLFIFLLFDLYVCVDFN